MGGTYACTESLENQLLNGILSDLSEPVLEFGFQFRQGLSTGIQGIALHIDRSQPHLSEPFDHSGIQDRSGRHNRESIGIHHRFRQDQARQKFMEYHSSHQSKLSDNLFNSTVV